METLDRACVRQVERCFSARLSQSLTQRRYLYRRGIRGGTIGTWNLPRDEISYSGVLFHKFTSCFRISRRVSGSHVRRFRSSAAVIQAERASPQHPADAGCT